MYITGTGHVKYIKTVIGIYIHISIISLFSTHISTHHIHNTYLFTYICAHTQSPAERIIVVMSHVTRLQMYMAYQKCRFRFT